MSVPLSMKLFEDVRGQKQLWPTASLSGSLAVAIATVVHLATLACLVGATALIVATWSQIVFFIFGLLLLGLAWVLRPRLTHAPKNVVPRGRLPTWYRVTDEVARAVGTAPVSGIVLTTEFNASFSQKGFPLRRAYLRLGLPLVEILSTEEESLAIGGA